MLELYYSPTCPYCRKVLSFFEANGIEFTPKDVAESNNYNTIIKLGGMAQVPFLVDTDRNKHMYESDAIIDYAKNLK